MGLAPIRWAASLFGVAQKVQALLDLQEKTSKALTKIDADVQALKVEIERLKAREEVVVARAEAAASTAAGSVAVHTTADLARRIGAIEASLPRLPPPDAR